MIKSYCDVCEKEIQDKDFMCEINIVTTFVDLIKNIKQPQKHNLQICKQCYDKHLKKTIKKLS